MMLATKTKYDNYAYRRTNPESKFEGGYPEWPLIDRLGNSWVSSLIWGVLYTSLYMLIATEWWHFLFLPVHFLMGPIHGVSWCGHRYIKTLITKTKVKTRFHWTSSPWASSFKTTTINSRIERISVSDGLNGIPLTPSCASWRSSVSSSLPDSLESQYRLSKLPLRLRLDLIPATHRQ